MEVDGQEGVHERLIAPASGSVRFAKALNRSVTGSMNDMMTPAAYWPAAGDVPPFDIGTRVNETPMSALKPGGPPYGFPRDVFEALVELAEGGRPMPAA
jgi:hypothetical protein